MSVHRPNQFVKIALVSYHFAENCVALAGALAGHAQVMLAMPEAEAAPFLAEIPSTVDFRPFGKPRVRHAARQLRTLVRLHHEIRSFSPDVLHVQGGHPWFTVSLPLLRRYPLVITVHDAVCHFGDAESSTYPQWILDYGAQRAQAIVVHASEVKGQLATRLRLSADQIHIVPLLQATGDRALASNREEDGTVLFFGRLWPYKGLAQLIAAEPLITREASGVRFVIAGQGEDFDRYRRMIVHPEKFVIHNRYLSHEERGNLFRQASIVVLPYVEASQSGVALLAYHYRKPVVATTVGGLPEQVEDGSTGLLVPPGDVPALATAILTLLHQPKLRQKFGMQGYQKLQTVWSPDVVAAQTLEVYRQAIRQAASSARSPVRQLSSRVGDR